MRRLMSALCTAGAVAGLIALPALPSQATPEVNRVRVVGQLIINDDEFFGDDRKVVSINTSVTVSESQPLKNIVIKDCAGGEVRAEVTLAVSDVPTVVGRVQITPTLLLFEGTSCSNNDLDGAAFPAAFRLDSNQSTRFNYRLNNTQEGGDWIRLDVSIFNDL